MEIVFPFGQKTDKKKTIQELTKKIKNQGLIDINPDGNSKRLMRKFTINPPRLDWSIHKRNKMWGAE